MEEAGSANEIWFSESGVFAPFMPVHGHSGGLGGRQASQPGDSTVVYGGVQVCGR